MLQSGKNECNSISFELIISFFPVTAFSQYVLILLVFVIVPHSTV